MVPVAVGVDFGTSNSVVAIADRSGQVQVRRFDTQVGTVEAYRSALLFFCEGRRPPNSSFDSFTNLCVKPTTEYALPTKKMFLLDISMR
jgi:hypothetical protein